MMRRPRACGALVWLWLLPWPAACGRGAEPPARPHVQAARPKGAWQGTGGKTVGDVASDSGHLRITWQTAHEDPSGAGTFRLTVRSAVSGRSMQVVVDRRGEGHGTVDFEDAPRIYDFLVESDHVEWSFSVEEVYDAYATEPSGASP